MKKKKKNKEEMLKEKCRLSLYDNIYVECNYSEVCRGSK